MATILSAESRARGRHVEWLETDGLGGFAMGTVVGIRTRRYHGLLVTATQPPAGRMVLVNGLNVSLENSEGMVRLTPQEYLPGNRGELYGEWLESFSGDPWPCWVYRVAENLRVIHELFMPHGSTAVVLGWRFEGNWPMDTLLRVRPFLSGRDFHALHHENPGFNFSTEAIGNDWQWRPYEGVPAVAARTNGRWVDERYWYRNFYYSEEHGRGLESVEDAASPGYFEYIDLTQPVYLVLAAKDGDRHATHDPLQLAESAQETYTRLIETERRRRQALGSPLNRAGDAYLVQRGKGKTIIAGYPWFGDWGRDTFISMRGICLASGRLAEAREILLEWSGVVSEGMLPNRFPDDGKAPEYNSVDASLWYVVACYEYLELVHGTGTTQAAEDEARLWTAIDQILDGYSQGTRFGIRMDQDGLLACGQHGLQLTWMDAKVGDWVVTPRIGKPVEVQALWLNALWIGAKRHPAWRTWFHQGLDAFYHRFWNPVVGGLFDVIDCDHQAGRIDGRLRPNQIFAVGGLPINLLSEEQARSVVRIVEESLWTPLGLRTLGAREAEYQAHYTGGALERDRAYHQGTVWPWLAGPFIEAWVRVHGGTDEAKRQARERFFIPLLGHRQASGWGHLCEIADAEPPHTPRGCPFQAWSVGELLRLNSRVLSLGSSFIS